MADDKGKPQHPEHSTNPAQRAPGNMSGQQTDQTPLDRGAGQEDSTESSQPGNRSGKGSDA